MANTPGGRRQQRLPERRIAEPVADHSAASLQIQLARRHGNESHDEIMQATWPRETNRESGIENGWLTEQCAYRRNTRNEPEVLFRSDTGPPTKQTGEMKFGQSRVRGNVGELR